MLFAVEAGGTEVERAIADFWAELPAEDAEGRPYADALVRGVLKDLEQTDAQIKKASQNWRLERMTRVDRNVLRMGAWELIARTDVPRAVILDEAVEVAKRFGTEESGAFVNGVLDRIAENLGRTDALGRLPRRRSPAQAETTWIFASRPPSCASSTCSEPRSSSRRSRSTSGRRTASLACWIFASQAASRA